ncbi:MAG: alpha/beta fold hydrolase [Candidatus Caldatribacteriota bacterium]
MIYRIDGKEGRPWIVFSNSLGTNMSMWDDQVNFLYNDYRILRYETIGVGRKSIDDLGKDLLHLMDTLEIPSAHFCGISLGGLIGQWLAINATDKFLSFAFSNTAPSIGSDEGWQQRIAQVKKEGLESVRKASSGRWFTQGFIERYPSKVEKALKGFDETRPEDYIALCEVLAKTNLWDGLPKINKPVLILAGAQDEVTTVAEAQKMGELIPQSVVKVLEASHLSNFEDPCFNEYLFNHISRD